MGLRRVPNANWAMFESHYGQDNGGLYLVITKMTSLAEEDQSMGDSKKFADVHGRKRNEEAGGAVGFLH